MPGYAPAALTFYSYLGCTGGPYKVQVTRAIKPYSYVTKKMYHLYHLCTGYSY